ncbi:MAG: ribokinase [Corynebacterium sp.]|nr:ribokinase [Corynebacterium sp.]
MIAVIGSTNMDLITYTDQMPAIGETLAARDFTVACGGKGANQAVAAARMGAEVVMVSKVGTDTFGTDALANFAANKIDTRHVKTVEGTTGVAPIMVDRNSDNCILIVAGANGKLSPEDVHAAADDILKCSHIVLQLEVPLETVYAAIEFGAKHNIPVILNPAPANPDLDLKSIAACTYVMPNESELATLTGMPVDSPTEVETAAKLLLGLGCEHVIVTMGSRGVLWINKEESTHIPPIEVEAVDTTGAGDSFIGCFAAELDRGASVADALAMANRYAATAVTGQGTQPSYPYRADMVGEA